MLNGAPLFHCLCNERPFERGASRMHAANVTNVSCIGGAACAPCDREDGSLPRWSRRTTERSVQSRIRAAHRAKAPAPLSVANGGALRERHDATAPHGVDALRRVDGDVCGLEAQLLRRTLLRSAETPAIPIGQKGSSSLFGREWPVPPRSLCVAAVERRVSVAYPNPIPQALHTRSPDSASRGPSFVWLQPTSAENVFWFRPHLDSLKIGCVRLGVWGMGYRRSHTPTPYPKVYTPYSPDPRPQRGPSSGFG